MTDTPESLPPSFGSVDFDNEHGVLFIDHSPAGVCRLTLVARTERGYPRRELAAIPGEVWGQIANAVQNELLRGMDPVEQGSKSPTFRSGDMAVSPLIARELAVLLWSLMEDEAGTHIESLMAGWRQLAREERWWLYARASNPSQRQGHGWRRALYFALTDPADTRSAPRLLDIMEAASEPKKKRSGARQIGSRQSSPKRKARSAKKPPAKNSLSKQVLDVRSHPKKVGAKPKEKPPKPRQTKARSRKTQPTGN
jgi:hypothetical protein